MVECKYIFFTFQVENLKSRKSILESMDEKLKMIADFNVQVNNCIWFFTKLFLKIIFNFYRITYVKVEVYF